MKFGDAPTVHGAAAITMAALLVSVALSACEAPVKSDRPATAPPTSDKVELTDSQLKAIAVQTAPQHVFSPQRTAFGSIDFDEDRAVQVYSNYPGKIVQIFAQMGDQVEKGQPLYSIQSPDLMQAESALIAAAGVYDLTTKALSRDRKLHDSKGVSDKDLDQAISDQMTAEGALKAARAAVLVFGKSDTEIDHLIAKRRIDPDLVVRSPIAGRVTSRNAQPGLLVQPGTAPAPFAVADLSTMWMVANVSEADVPLFRKGQAVSVKVMAFPDREFDGAIAVTGATVDPTTHTELVRADIRDPHHELHPGMMATYVIHTGSATKAVAVPAEGVVRDGDGAMNVWVTTDNHHFTRRTVKIGLQQDGFDQILDGVGPTDRVVVNGAVFLSNMANADAGE